MIEHLYPRELLVADLLNDAASIGPADAVELLTDRLMAAVVTRHEDRWLPTRAESARPWADYASDSWLRYRASGLDLDAFARLRD